MAEIERNIGEHGVSYSSSIKCKTVTGVPCNNLFAIVAVDNPTEICIGTLYGLYGS